MGRRNQGPRLRWLDKRGCYYITWTERGRSRERSTGTARREQAEVALAQFIQERTRRTGPRDPSAILVTDILDRYLRERGPNVAAPSRIAYAVLPLIDYFEGNTVADVTPRTCARYADTRGCSAGTVRRELGVLRAAINWAYKNADISRPVAVALPARPEPRDRWLTRDEAARLIHAAKTPQARLYLPLFILIGIYTGRRKRAILSLRWPQVDLDAGLIDFEVPGRGRTNKKRGKGVPIPPRLLPHLRRARRRGTDLGYVIHRSGKNIGDIKDGLEAACKRAGLEGVSSHTLRHTCATWLMRCGTDPWQASGFLSMGLQTLLAVYGHHHPDHQREAAENIGKRPERPRNVRVIG